MKKSLFLTVLLSVFCLSLIAQQTTLKWTYQVTPKVSEARTETFDWTYGRYGRTVTAPFKLAIDQEGEYLTGLVAYAELQKPIWGQYGNQQFKDVLPNLTPAVLKWIFPADAENTWHSFTAEPANNDTWPVTMPANGRGWECEDATTPGKYYQNMDLSSVQYWGLLHIWRYRQQKLSTIERIPVLNPEYEIVEAQRTADREAYAQVLSETFVQLGTYYFPSFKAKEGAKWWLKKEGETKFNRVDYDPNYWLATPTGTWKPILLPVKASELKAWLSYANATILSTGDARVKLLLGIK